MFRRKRFVLLILMLAVTATSFFLILKNTYFKADALQNQVSIQTPKFAVSLQTEENGEKFKLKDFGTISSPGNPDLPIKEVSLLLPPNIAEDSVTVSLVGSKQDEIQGNHEIAPSPPAVVNVDGKETEDWGSGKKIVNDKNENIYKKDALYPPQNIEIKSVGNMRQYKIASVKFYPFQYNPVTKKIIRTTGGQITLSYKQIQKSNSPSLVGENGSSDPFKDILPSVVDNAAEAKNWYPEQDQVSLNARSAKAAVSQSSKGGILIVTTNAIVAGSKKLATFKGNKENLGFSPVTIATETQWGGGTGNAAADRVRNYLKANYTNYKYALLIGNPDPGTGDVPMKMTWPRRGSTTYQEAPTDYVYADLSSNWDKNGNGFWGEWGEENVIDLLPEIYVGRIPYYGSITDLDSILTKTMAYENSDLGADWVKRILVDMVPSDASTPGYYLGEAIKKDVADTITPVPFPTTRIYDNNYGLNPAPEYTPNSFATFNSVLESTHPGFVFWWTHGNETVAADIVDSGKAATFSDSVNNHPFFTFQNSCLNAFPENTNNLGYALLKRGSIGTVSATRVSWYFPGQVDYTNTSSNAGMGYQYAKALVKSHLPAGAALYISKFNIPYQFGDAVWMNYLVFNLYGDPSLGYLERVGPTINTTSLIDTDNTAAPYNITATIRSNHALSGAVVKWNSDGSQAYQPVAMTRVGSTDDYTAQIPTQPNGATVHYYIEATDSKGTEVAPGSAPKTPFSFKVAPDTVTPVITAQPLVDTAFTAGPYIVNATVTDDRVLGNAKLLYSINGGPDNTIVMQNMGSNVFQAEIPGPRASGDVIDYHIVAEDASLNKNKTNYPPSGSVRFAILLIRKVAIYNSTVNPPYFMGGNSNAYQQVSDILTSDSQMRFVSSVITKIDSTTLAGQDVLILPDNAPANSELQAIQNWYKPGKEIITFDNSSSYAAVSGFLWTNTVGTNGYNVAWNTSASQNDQLIKLADPITSKYKIGDIIDSRGYTTSFISSAIPTDAKILTVSNYNPNNQAYAIYRDTPDAGRFVAFGPFVPLQENQYDLIRDAAASVVIDTPPLPVDTAAPSIPANLKLVSKGIDSVSLAWDASIDNVGIVGYKVYRNNLEVGNVSVTTFDDTGLTPNTSYIYTVAAYDAAGNYSNKSTALSVTTDPRPIDTIPPSTPKNIKVTAHSSTSMSFSWDASTDNVGVTGYWLFMSGEEKANVPGSLATVNFTNACYNCGYYVTVAAYDAVGNYSEESTGLYVVTDLPPDTTPPSVPTGLAVTNKTADSISLKWNPSTDVGPGNLPMGASLYNVYRNDVKIRDAVNAGTTVLPEYTDTGLSASTTYNYKVTALDGSLNESAKSVQLTETTAAKIDTIPPSIPANLRLVSKTANSINLAWDASTDNVGVVGYKVFRNNVGIAIPAATNYSNTGLTAGTTYSYTVSAYDAIGNNSAKSAPLSATTDTLTPANTELNIQVLSSNSIVQNATVQLIVNGQVAQTAVWKYTYGYYTFPQYVQRNTGYTVKISATGYATKTVQITTANATPKSGYPNVYTQLVKVTMSWASTYSSVANTVTNYWQRFLGLFR